MKRLLLLSILFIAVAGYAEAQRRVLPNKPYRNLNTLPGYITVNEFGAGFGIRGTSTPYSKYFFGFTSIHGYQFDQYLVVGGGTGISVYEDGVLIPLFIDIRYRFSISTVTFYAFGDGGFFLNPWRNTFSNSIIVLPTCSACVPEPMPRLISGSGIPRSLKNVSDIRSS